MAKTSVRQTPEPDHLGAGCGDEAWLDWLAIFNIAGNPHPDHTTLATFRLRFGQAFEVMLVVVLPVARENPSRHFGAVSLDGTKIHANASAGSSAR